MTLTENPFEQSSTKQISKRELLARFNKIPYDSEIDSIDLNSEFADILLQEPTLRQKMELKSELWNLNDFKEIEKILLSYEFQKSEVHRVFKSYSPKAWLNLDKSLMEEAEEVKEKPNPESNTDESKKPSGKIEIPLPEAVPLPIVEEIPDELKERIQWVLWKYEIRADARGKETLTKVPYKVKSWKKNTEKYGKATTINPKTWGSFQDAYHILSDPITRGEFHGLGMVFTPEDNYVGVDADHVYDKVTGKWNGTVLEDVKKLNSYAEISVSGEGAHIILCGNKPAEKCRAGNWEMYQAGRYFTFTGNHIAGTPKTINENPDAIKELYDKRINTTKPGKKDPPKKEKRKEGEREKIPTHSDDEVIEAIKKSSLSTRFERLYNGNFDEYPSQSEADLALIGIIGSHSSDKSQVDRIFCRSGLYREEKGTDYRKRTIKKVFDGFDEFSKDFDARYKVYPYVLTPMGVGKEKTIEDPEDPSGKKTKKVLEYFLRTPTFITYLSDDLDGEKILYKVRIEHPVNGNIDIWKDQGELLTKSGVTKLLSEGLIGIDSSYREITAYYMKDILRAVTEAPKEFIARKTGWKRANTIFVAGNKAYTEKGNVPVKLTDEDVQKAFSNSGTLDGWVNGCKWILQHDSTRINCYVACASVVAGLLKQPSPILQNKGNTTTGKTLKSSVAVSMFGDPTELIKSADTTRTNAERDAIATNGMCTVLDEVGLLKNPDGLTYLLSNGRKKGRGTKEGREGTEYWFKSFILNGEFEFLKESAAQGEIGRLIECTENLPKDAINAKSTEVEIKEHYGQIAPLFMKKLFSRIDSIKDRYMTLCSSLPTSNLDIGSRITDSFTLIIIAGEILEEVFEDIKIERKNPFLICEKLYLENINSERVKPYWIRGLNLIIDEINVCKQETGHDGELRDTFLYKGQIGGVREYDGIFIDVLSATFTDMCNKYELKHTQLMKEWRENGITEVDKPEVNKPDKKGKIKNQKTIKIEGETKKAIRLIKTEVYKTLDIEIPNESINRAVLKHDVSRHLEYYKTLPDEEKESFPISFFKEYPLIRKNYTVDKIMDIVLEIEAEAQ